MKKNFKSHKAYASLNIAIIGKGNMVDSYAAGFGYFGHQVLLACKNSESPYYSTLANVFSNINIFGIEEAAQIADIIIIAVPVVDVREVAYWLGDVRNKIIIDFTNNIDENNLENFNTVTAITTITGAKHIVKAYDTNGYEAIVKPILKESKVDMILAGNSQKAKEIAKIMVKELGIKYCIDFGGSDKIPILDEMSHNWKQCPSFSRKRKIKAN